MSPDGLGGAQNLGAGAIWPYVGRFAPSPTGALHAGSLVAALGSWLDARAHHGRWLVRVEDTDTPRCSTQSEALILSQLQALGLNSDGPVWRQSERSPGYEAALQKLRQRGHAYGCVCSRRKIEAHWQERGRVRERHAETPYPGWCRNAGHTQLARSWRLRCGSEQAPLQMHWTDRRLGAQQQNLSTEVGDFVLKRADGVWAYQLAVVVDDAEQGITDVVRGEDLADNTPRQRHLQACLGLPHPRTLHLPLVKAADGQKLSKQTGAAALDLASPSAALQALHQAARVLELPVGFEQASANLEAFFSRALPQWAGRWLQP
jgi:glutamyl-Q tRNA(Asp) synthetase